MEENRYDIIFGNQLVCENCNLQDALVIIKALTEAYYEEIKIEKGGIRLVVHGLTVIQQQ